VLVQLPSLRKKKFTYRPCLDLKSSGMKKTVALALPILISSWVQPINSTVNLYLANFLNDGQAAPALDYANKLYIIFVGVLTYGISNLIFPTVSRLAAGDNKKELATLIAKATKIVLAVILPVMVLFLLLRTPIVRFVYERGEFGPDSTALTASALLFYSFGMAGFGVSEILNKAFYATKDGKTPMFVAIAGISLNILLSFLFIRGLHTGLWGLALAASIAANVIALFHFILLQKQLRFFGKQDVKNVLKLVFSAVVMGILVFVTSRVCSFDASFFGKILALALPGLVGLGSYLLLMFLLKTEEAEDILKLLTQKAKKVE
ncbi:MAG: polysaccharide biosynthesis C-terminal domain-containing protein, partial [Clostridia bacterium]|nr:polysaccharide biosynthesis C-terminal domain-containing protein [Clostridia bacterium]